MADTAWQRKGKHQQTDGHLETSSGGWLSSAEQQSHVEIVLCRTMMTRWDVGRGDLDNQDPGGLGLGQVVNTEVSWQPMNRNEMRH